MALTRRFAREARCGLPVLVVHAHSRGPQWARCAGEEQSSEPADDLRRKTAYEEYGLQRRFRPQRELDPQGGATSQRQSGR